MTTHDAKHYLAAREIPQLFESLMTGLMYYRPEDHITYLQECLRKIKEDGIENVKWNIFIDSRKKTPLPPIQGGDNGRTVTPMGRDPSFITDRPQSLEEKRGSPLPPIGQSWQADNAANPDRITLPNCPFVLIMGGPGSGRATQCKKLLEKYKGWVHLSMGDLLREQIFDKGSADEKWGMIGSLVSKGQLAPEDMTIDMVKSAIAKHMDAKGIIIEGYPRTMEQVQDYDKYIGRVDLAFCLDCEEYYMQQRLLSRGQVTGRVDDNINAVASRISFFKDKTLPAIKHYDDMGKLVIVDGDRDTEEINYDLAVLFQNVFYAKSAGEGVAVQPRPPSAPKPRPGSTRYSRPGSRAGRPGSGFSNVPVNINVAVSDTGRKAGMPSCPVIFIMGGPGSNKNTQCKKIAAKYPGLVHLSIGDMLREEILKNGTADQKWEMIKKLVNDGEMAPEDVTLDLLRSAVERASGAKAVVVEGFPRNKQQVEQFNQFFGGLNMVVLIDCEETTLRKTLKDRAAATDRLDDSEQAINKRISNFKYKCLPILGFYDDEGKLSIVSGDDRSIDEVFSDIVAIVDPIVASNVGGSSEAVSASGVTPPIKVSPADSGRKAGLPEVSVIAMIGSPGSGSDSYVKQVAEKLSCPYVSAKSASEVASTLKSNSSAKLLIVEGFPCTKTQVEDFNNTVGGMTGVIVLDCDEEFAKSKAETNQIDTYKCEGLPTLGYFEEHRKLDLVDIQKSSDVVGDAKRIIEEMLAKPAPTTPPTATSGALPTVTILKVGVHDKGRKGGLPNLPIVGVIGGPCSGYEAHCKTAAEKLSALHLQNHSVEGVLSSIQSIEDQKFVLLEGLPKNKAELELFNEKVGGMAGVVVFDTSDEYCLKNGADSDKIKEYKAKTLPVLGHYEDKHKLELVKGEESDVDLCKAIATLLSESEP